MHLQFVSCRIHPKCGCCHPTCISVWHMTNVFAIWQLTLGCLVDSIACWRTSMILNDVAFSLSLITFTWSFNWLAEYFCQSRKTTLFDFSSFLEGRCNALRGQEDPASCSKVSSERSNHLSFSGCMDSDNGLKLLNNNGKNAIFSFSCTNLT